MMKPTPTTSRPLTSSARKPKRRWRKWLPYALASALLIALINAFRPRPVEVEIATVATGPFVVSVLEEGKTRIRHRYVISPPVAGFLNRVPLRAGDSIEAGKTVLAVIQPQPANFLDPRARTEAEARAKAAEAAQDQRQTQVERARAALDLAQKEMARAAELKKSGAIAAKEWDAAESQATILSRELHSAEFALKVAEFELKQAQAALTQVQQPGANGAEPLQIVAPVNGFVLNVFEESARVIAAGTPILEVGDPTDLEAEIELLSSDAVGVRPGAEVSIEQWGGRTPLRGKVTAVEPGGFTKISALGVEEQRVKTRVDFVDPLPPGTFLGDRFRVEARIVTWRGENVLQLPTGALFRRGGDWMAFVVEGGKARLAKVEIGHHNGTAAEIRGGLAQSQMVIVHPPDAIGDGASVRQKEVGR
jgi:HlyD family secretion protein